MLSQSFEPRITLKALQASMRLAPIDDVETFIDMFVVDRGLLALDWMGELSLSIKDAGRIRNQHFAAAAAEQAQRAAYSEYLAERNAACDDAAHKAFELESRVRKLEAPRDLRVPGLPLGAGWASITMNGHPVRLDNPMEVEHAREALEHARAAAQEARQRFDSRNPELDFKTWVQKKNGRKAAAAA